LQESNQVRDQVNFSDEKSDPLNIKITDQDQVKFSSGTHTWLFPKDHIWTICGWIMFINQEILDRFQSTVNGNCPFAWVLMGKFL
jgi:hypothetical protein